MLEPTNEEMRKRAKYTVGSTSQWDDGVWTWEGGSPGTPPNCKKLRWDVAMGNGTRFSDPQWAEWAEAVKITVWSLMADPPPERKAVRVATAGGIYRMMRVLVKWMKENGYQRLNQLTRAGQRAFILDVRRRKGRGRNAKRLKKGTVAKYQNTLQTLFLQGRRYPQIAIEEPAPQDTIRVSTRYDHSPTPRTPEPIAIALIARATTLLGSQADDIIEARDRILELEGEAEKNASAELAQRTQSND